MRTIAATWALAADAMTADAVATTLFFDASGTLQNIHFGEISRAELLSQIATIDTAASNLGDGYIPDSDQTGDHQ